MSDLVPMKALRSWNNPQYEGHIDVGDDFDAKSEERAKELERNKLAVRRPALSGKTVEVQADASPESLPMEFAVQPRPLSESPGQARKGRRS